MTLVRCFWLITVGTMNIINISCEVWPISFWMEKGYNFDQICTTYVSYHEYNYYIQYC